LDVLRQNHAAADAAGTINAKTTMPNHAASLREAAAGSAELDD